MSTENTRMNYESENTWIYAHATPSRDANMARVHRLASDLRYYLIDSACREGGSAVAIRVFVDDLMTALGHDLPSIEKEIQKSAVHASRSGRFSYAGA